ncbi:MAG: hypothetical protein V7K48_22905 [Nostoc sp.]|uniref:hypothetical protein n=1 Tax=Nostoc sp. TaxID=1180 RepID=UPI002FF62AF1
MPAIIAKFEHQGNILARSMVEKNALLELTNPDYPEHQVALEHQKSDLPLHQ